MSKSLLKINNLEKTFTNSAKPALKNISAEIFVWFNNGGAYTTYAEALAAGVNTGRSALMNIGLATGAATPVNLNEAGLQNFTVASPVPEPSTLALAGLGGFGMLMAFRRKKA